MTLLTPRRNANAAPPPPFLKAVFQWRGKFRSASPYVRFGRNDPELGSKNHQTGNPA
jgi:hypothetical protein